MKRDSVTYFLRRGICPVCKSKMNKKEVLGLISKTYQNHFECETCESLFIGSNNTGLLANGQNNFFVLYEENDDGVLLYKRFGHGGRDSDFVRRFKQINSVLVNKIKLMNYYYNNDVMYYRFDGQHSFRKCADKSFRKMFENTVICTRREFEEEVLTYVDKVLSYRYNKASETAVNFPVSVFREFEIDDDKTKYLKNNLHINKFIDLLDEKSFYIRRFNKQDFITLFKKIFRGEEDDENKSIVV